MLIGLRLFLREKHHRLENATFVSVRESDDQPPLVLVRGTGANLNSIPKPPASSFHEQLSLLVSQLQKDIATRYTMDQLVGTSDHASQLKRKIEAASSNQADCLIIGPLGSGREHLARTIFESRPTTSGDLVPIHCAIADSHFIQESIKEWAFEQREKSSQGWLLLLDVDKMQTEAQLELYGYTQLPNFPMRVLATSEFDLEELAEQNDFHRGLATQLSIQIIRLRSLASRSEDLPLLAQHFVEQCNLETKSQISGFADETLELLYEYQWPGNIDELKRCVCDAHSNCRGKVITATDLPDSFHHSLSASRIGYRQIEKIELDQFLEDIESKLIERALKLADNNRTKAAELLGVNRAKLLRRAGALQLLKKTIPESDQQIDSSAFKEAEN